VGSENLLFAGETIGTSADRESAGDKKGSALEWLWGVKAKRRILVKKQRERKQTELRE